MGGYAQNPELYIQKKYAGKQILPNNIILTDSKMQKIKALSGMEPKEQLVSFYEVYSGNTLEKYVYIDIHRVRSKNEAVLFAISPSGKIDEIEILSFKEPKEYKPQPSWLEQFTNKGLEQPLRYKYDIDGITGATLSGMAITDNTRKVLAIWKVSYNK